ncbi:hypothetical protein MHZ93_01460 [Roseomonas sp. ACRSG]|nr:hypothetical protein [Roseomonas sp. ACRSG]
MSSLVAAIQHLLSPLWTLMGERTWTCVIALALLAVVVTLLGFPVPAAFMAAVAAILLMWKAEHPSTHHS